MSTKSDDNGEASYRIKVQKRDGRIRVLLLSDSGTCVLNPDVPWSKTFRSALLHLNADIGDRLVTKGLI